MSRARLQRLERWARYDREPVADDAVVALTAGETETALRHVLSAVRRRWPEQAPEQFPGLAGEPFVLAFWGWLLEHAGNWPAWGQGAALRIAGCYLRDAGLIDAVGQATDRSRQLDGSSRADVADDTDDEAADPW